MALGFRLTLRALPDGRLALSVPLFFRFLLAAVGALILLSMLLSATEAEARVFVPANTVPLIVCLLSLLGAAYQERWLFDRPQNRVTHQYGLLFAHTNRSYRISEMSGIELEQLAKGYLPGSLPGEPPREGSAAGGLPAPRGFFFRSSQVLTLSLRGKDGSVYRLESYTASQRPRMVDAARSIAEYCRLPLIGVQDSTVR